MVSFEAFLQNIHDCGPSGPGEVSLHRFPVARKHKLTAIHQAHAGLARKNRSIKGHKEPSPVPGIEALSWRHRTDRASVEHLDFAWRRGEMCYLMLCSAPARRFASLEPLFLHIARSCRLNSEDTPSS